MLPLAKDIEVSRDRAGILAALRDQLEQHRCHQARQAGWRRRVVTTGLAPLDEVLPEEGIPCGAIIEILACSPGVGAMSLAMRVAGRSLQPAHLPFFRPPVHLDCVGFGEQVDEGRGVVLIDTLGDFYPPAALQQGIDLERLIVLRIRDEREAFWAADQALRCPAVATVIASFRWLDERSSRRLQLAAESSGCIGLMLMPATRRGKSFAAVQMLVEGVEGKKATRQQGNEARGSREPFVPSALRRYSQRVEPALRPESLDSSVPSSPCPFPAAPLRRFVAPSLRRFLLRVTLLKVREGMPVGPVVVDLEHETGTVSLPSLSVDRPVAQTG